MGGLTLTADGVTVIDGSTRVPDDPVEAMTRPGELRAALWLEAGADTRLRLEFLPAADGAGASWRSGSALASRRTTRCC